MGRDGKSLIEKISIDSGEHVSHYFSASPDQYLLNSGGGSFRSQWSSYGEGEGEFRTIHLEPHIVLQTVLSNRVKSKTTFSLIAFDDLWSENF